MGRSKSLEAARMAAATSGLEERSIATNNGSVNVAPTGVSNRSCGSASTWQCSKPGLCHESDEVHLDRFGRNENVNLLPLLPGKADVISRTDLFCCDQAAIAMRTCPGLASIKLAPLSWGSTTCGTSDSEYLLWGEFFFHGGRRIPQTLRRSRRASVLSQRDEVMIIVRRAKHMDVPPKLKHWYSLIRGVRKLGETNTVPSGSCCT
jgi:hypothetical protein